MKVEAIMGSVTACLVFFTIFNYILEIHVWSTFRLHTAKSTKVYQVGAGKEFLKLTMSPQDPHLLPRVKPPVTSPITCDRSHGSYDICSINGPAILDPKVSTFYYMGHTNFTIPSVEKVRPYPRKQENFKMAHIKEVTLTSGPSGPPCKVQHNAPAIIFSAKGNTGNFFHDFNDGFIPLFITVNSVFSDQDFIIVVSEADDWWAHKYADLLRSFTKHAIINLGKDTATHCFPSVTVGLISHGYMTIDPKLIPNSKTIYHFHALLETTYGQNPPSIFAPPKDRPRLVLVSRRDGIGRMIVNQAELKRVTEEEGFEVIIWEPRFSGPVNEAYDLLSSSHVMIGVHGAALTNSLFLRPGSVFKQVVPIQCEWLAEVCFGKVAKDMGLEYMEYKIGLEESSLIEMYGKDGMVALQQKNKGWSNEIMGIFLKKQNVKLDLVRFRVHLKKAYQKAKLFMEKEG